MDERSELAGSYLGRPQNDLGMRTDVLDGCPKAQGCYYFCVPCHLKSLQWMNWGGNGQAGLTKSSGLRLRSAGHSAWNGRDGRSKAPG